MAQESEPGCGDSPKALGAFYTDAQVADFLVWWAVRSGRDAVLDPSFGGGVFLRSASKRLLRLGGCPEAQIYGIELDTQVHSRITEKLHDEFGIPPRNLLMADFFGLSRRALQQVDAIVGNPPFIRYQRFSGEIRKRALTRAAEMGLRLSELSSSWLPFLVHSIGFIREGGRIAMVLPFEIAHARYASPALEFLMRSFASVTLLTFKKRLFPDLSEDTLLLLAEGRGQAKRPRILTRDLSHPGLLARIRDRQQRPIRGTKALNAQRIASGAERIIESLIPPRARDLYRELRTQPVTVRLADLADVGIGYVTGANEFFHLGPQAATDWGIPKRYLRPAVRRGRSLVGLRFTNEDWHSALTKGEASYLLHIADDEGLPDPVLRYLERGEKLEVHKAFKCRTRSPWFRVPHVYHPDAFLTYMSGSRPRLVANDAGVVAPNSLHVLRLHRDSPVGSDALAAVWQTSLTRLSSEIEGHALGGGMLKLEPGEAENVLLPWPAKRRGLGALATDLDQTARQQGVAACSWLADRELLRKGLGLSAADCDLLRTAAEALYTRRMSR
jgi:hypothetical protein